MMCLNNILIRVFVAVLKQRYQKQVEEERVVLILECREVRAGTQGRTQKQELKSKSSRTIAYWIAFVTFSVCLLCHPGPPTQPWYCPWDSPTSTINWEITPQSGLQVNLCETDKIQSPYLIPCQYTIQAHQLLIYKLSFFVYHQCWYQYHNIKYSDL